MSRGFTTVELKTFWLNDCKAYFSTWEIFKFLVLSSITNLLIYTVCNNYSVLFKHYDYFWLKSTSIKRPNNKKKIILPSSFKNYVWAKTKKTVQLNNISTDGTNILIKLRIHHSLRFRPTNRTTYKWILLPGEVSTKSASNGAII